MLHNSPGTLVYLCAIPMGLHQQGADTVEEFVAFGKITQHISGVEQIDTVSVKGNREGYSLFETFLSLKTREIQSRQHILSTIFLHLNRKVHVACKL